MADSIHPFCIGSVWRDGLVGGEGFPNWRLDTSGNLVENGARSTPCKASFGREYKPMGEGWLDHDFNVIGENEAETIDRRLCLGTAKQGE